MHLPTVAGIVLFAASAPSSSVEAFSSIASRSHVSTSSTWRTASIPQPLTLRQMSEDASAEDSTVGTEEATAEETESPPPEEMKLDPAVVELKENIAKLEADVKRKKGELADLKEMAERYSQTGYARQVALLENNKRRRGENVADSKSSARATVVKTFVPVLEELDAVAAQYEGNSFAKSLDALRSGMKSSLEEIGVTEYVVAEGDAVDAGRVVAVEEVYSEDFAAGTVISAKKSGLEIQGNVIRPAEVVASLGVESSEEEASEEEESGEAAESE